MKKAVAITLILCALAAMCGCGAKAVVTSAALTDREKTLLSAQSEYSFVFDFTPGDWQWVSFWADEYRKGKSTGSYLLSAQSLGMNDNGTIVIYVPRTNGKVKEQLNFSVMSGGVSSTGTDVIPGFSDIFDYGVAWQTCDSPDITESGKNTLLCIRGHNNGFSPVGSDFYRDYESNLEQIADDEITYVIGCTFSNEKPQ